MTPGSIDHVLLTRFNVPTPGLESLVRAREGWLRSRVDLFERFCLPSVLAQTRKSFKWIVYFDPESPGWFLEWLSESNAGNTFQAIFRESINRDQMRSDVRNVTGAAGDTLLTTNLDNDDGLAVDFVQRLQDAVSPGTREALYFTTGIILRGADTFLRTDRKNAFCSVAEGWDEPVMAWAEWHNRLDRIMPVQEIGGSPGWLQVVHELNVSNTVHGRLVTPSAYAELFPFALKETPEPESGRLLLDAILRRPFRAVRSTTRSLAKSVIIGSVGPKGLDALKNRSALARNRMEPFLRRTVRSEQAEAASHGAI